MRTVVPEKPSDLFAFAAQAADGCHALETVIGLAHNTEAPIRKELETARSVASQFEAAKAARLVAAQRQAEAQRASTKWLYAARDCLKQFLGRSYSQAWNQAGFTGNSLGVPVSIQERLERLKSLELYFAAHLDQELKALGITHGAAALRYAELSEAMTGLNAARTIQRTRRQARDAAIDALSRRMRGLISELKQVLGPRDPRWLDFGFNIPADARVNGSTPKDQRDRESSEAEAVEQITA